MPIEAPILAGGTSLRLLDERSLSYVMPGDDTTEGLLW